MKLDVTQLSVRTQPVFSGCSRIVAAYLFGSAASDRMRSGSDVDIAVLLEEGEIARDRKALLETLLSPLSRMLRADVHLLFLNDASYPAGTNGGFHQREAALRKGPPEFFGLTGTPGIGTFYPSQLERGVFMSRNERRGRENRVMMMVMAVARGAPMG